MGFFSWKCAVSGESIANIHAGKPRNQSRCVLVTPTEAYHEPAYDGYGVFDGEDVYELLGEGDRIKGIYSDNPTFKIKLVLEEHYNGQTYDELPESESCPVQGYFYGEEEE